MTDEEHTRKVFASHVGETAGTRSAAIDRAAATVEWNGRWYIVVVGGVEYARFSVMEKKSGQDFANGFNAGASYAKR